MLSFIYFFFNDTATTEIYTLSLHDALPISGPPRESGSLVTPGTFSPMAASTGADRSAGDVAVSQHQAQPELDRKSTRLISSHMSISYAVFCLKKKKKQKKKPPKTNSVCHSI